MHVQYMQWKALSAAMAIAVALSACTGSRDLERLRYVHGLNPTLQADEAATNSINQENVLIRLASDAQSKSYESINLSSIEPNDWQKITGAGFNLVDSQCEMYLDALFWWNRYRRTTVTQLGLVGASSAAILGIVQASAAAIAVTATAFGLTAATVENLGNSVLYELDPSGVKSIVTRSLNTYRGSVQWADVNDRPTAVAVIQGYLSLCLPASIETRVNEAVGNTTFVAAEDNASIVPVLRPVSVTQLAGATAKQVAGAPVEIDTSAGLIQPPPRSLPGAMNDAERRMSGNELITFQRSLCVEPPAPTFGPETRAAVLSLRGAMKLSPLNSIEFDDGVLKTLRSSELREPCELRYNTNLTNW